MLSVVLVLCVTSDYFAYKILEWVVVPGAINMKWGWEGYACFSLGAISDTPCYYDDFLPP